MGEPMNAQSRATADLMVLMMATLSGMSISILALLLSHGWRAPLLSATAIVLAPAAGIVWCYRDRSDMTRFAKLLTAINAVLDLAFLLGTSRQAWSAAVESAAPLLAVWIALWGLWQLLGALAMRRAVTPETGER